MNTQQPKLSDGSATKMGRPSTEFNRTIFERLCKIQCTREEIASVMGVCGRTILRRCKEIYGVTFEEIYQQFSSAGLVSLRRAQFNLAKTNASMAIFLGKNYLGQSDQGYTDSELTKAIERELATLRPTTSPEGSHG